MEAFIALLPQLTGALEKGGVVALMILVIAVLGYEVRRLRRELGRTYDSRDRYRVGYALCKAALEAENIHIDLSPMKDMEDD